MKKSFESGVLRLRLKLAALETLPAITACIMATVAIPGSTFLPNATPEVTMAATEQDLIGWDNTLEGKLSQHWRRLQDDHYRDTGSKRYGKRWATYVVQELLALTHTQWTTRNKILHSVDEQGMPILEGAELNAAVTTAYQTTQDILLATDRHLLTDRTLEQLLRRPPTEKETWLQSLQLALELATEERNTELHGMRNIFEQWLDNPG
jgi:hypothetical protein